MNKRFVRSRTVLGFSRHLKLAISALFSIAVFSASGAAAEKSDLSGVPPGTVITAQNFDELAARSFEGHVIGEMIPKRYEWQIRTQGATLRLGKTVPRAVDPRVARANEMYAHRVKLNPSTKEIEGYVTGTPFAQVDVSDPLAGTKLLWNVHYASSRKTTSIMWAPLISFVLIDSHTGIERVQTWELKEKYYVGTLDDLSNPSRATTHSKALFRATFPQDIKGIGTLTIRYTTGMVDDVWAYIRAVRRVRRLSGGAWHDNIQSGFDALQDDVGGWNGYPTWYPQHKLLGKMTGLVMAGLPGAAFNPLAENVAERYPIIDSVHAPYWHPTAPHSPRDLYVLEVVTPEHHPYSKKIIYFDTELWNVHFVEAYDRKGDFWRWANIGAAKYSDESDPSINYEVSSTGQFVDYQNLHGSWFVTGPGLLMNPPGISDTVFSFNELEAGGR